MRSASTKEPILLVANFESDVGYAWWLMENFWHLISMAASDQGRACLLAYPRIGAIPDVIRDSPVETVEFKFDYRTWADVRRGLALIRSRNIRAIYLTDWPYFHPAYLLWRLVGVRRIVMHDHSGGDRPTLSGVRAFLKDALHATRVFAPSRFVAVSPFIARRMQSNGRVPASRCTTVTNGIRPFHCDRDSRGTVRRSLKIPDEAVLVSLVSRATHNKNLEFAVRCMAAVLQDPEMRDRVYAVHCGDGPDLGAFEAAVDAAGISDRFRFLGRRPDVRAILCASDIAFHPSKYEAMSLAILEFMNAELAILTSDAPSVCAAIEPGATGLTYQRDSEADACRQLRVLIGSEELRRSLGTRAAQTCRERYSLDAMNRAFVDGVLPAL